MCSSATAAIPAGLLDLSAELDALGGGDARIGEAAVYCRVRPGEPGDEMIVGVDGNHVLVHDPRGRADAPTQQQSVRRFRVSADAALDPDERGSQAALFESLGNAALEWVLQACAPHRAPLSDPPCPLPHAHPSPRLQLPPSPQPSRSDPRAGARMLQGFNATVVAHGETGSGKTHSLFGPHGVFGRT